MKLEKAEVIYINPPKVTGAGTDKEFKSIEIGIKTEDELNGNTYSNYFSMQATQKKCSDLDTINVGDVVNIDFGIRGTLKEKSDMAETPKNKKKQVIYTNMNLNQISLVTPATSNTSTPKDSDEVPF